MRDAIYDAALGDDVFGEDPSVNRLEAMAAERLGKEAAVLVTSGTMGNLIGVLSNADRGDEVIVGELAHVLLYEVAGVAAIGGVQLRPVSSPDGRLDLNEVESTIRGKNVHLPPTAVVCVENTHNRFGGAVLEPAYMDELESLARRHGLKVHLDGARLFNAAVALGVDVRVLTAAADTVTFCLSKGLSCPVGSVLCGSEETIGRARRIRKMLGAGMRQAGIIAAAGIYALENMVDRLEEDHANARRLAEGLAPLPGLDIDLEKAQSNILIFDVTGEINAEEFAGRMADEDVRFNPIGPTQVRMVTHYGIERSDIDVAIDAARRVLTGD
jgi:threonine aldolase